MKLGVAEVFHSLQGEGGDAGVPAVFLRLAGCNLRCRDCDTRYAWEGGEEVPVSLIKERLDALPCRYLVVTGGEPLLQARPLERLVSLLSAWTLTLETNATIWEPRLLGRFHLVTASPKLPSAGVGPFPREVFSKYMDLLPPRLQVKLVVDREDWDEVDRLVDGYPSLGETVPLVIQPVEREENLEDYLSRAREWAETFLERAALWGRKRVRFLPQLHKVLWWGQWGV